MSTTIEDNVEILLKASLEKLVFRANEVRKDYIGTKLELCSILNARSGLCSADCKFCTQSARYCTDVLVYPLMGKDEIVSAAQHAKAIGLVGLELPLLSTISSER